MKISFVSKSFFLVVLVALSAVLTGCQCSTPWGSFGVSTDKNDTASVRAEAVKKARAEDNLSAERRRLATADQNYSSASSDSEREVWARAAQTRAAEVVRLEGVVTTPPTSASAVPTAPVQGAVTKNELDWFYWSGWGDTKSPLWALVLILSFFAAVLLLRDANEEWAAATPVVVALVGAVFAALTPGSQYAGRLIAAGVLLAIGAWLIQSTLRGAGGALIRIPLGILMLLLFYGLV